MSESAETLGQRLQAARATKGLSAQKAADELHLDGWVIEGLESGNYERIGPAVYAKGHLKRYAELLGLPVAEVLASFDGSPPPLPPPAQPATMRMRTSSPSVKGLPWPSLIGVAVAVLAVAAVLWWRPWHPRVSATAAVSSPAVPAAQSPAAASAPVAGTANGAGASGTSALPAGAPGAPGAAAGGPGGSIAAPAAGGPPAAGPVASAADAKAASGRARLRLSFLGDSWVDVHDANGQRLFAGNGHVNNVRSLSGEAPFRIYLKSASSIRLEINNHVVAIGPQYLTGDAAHFEAGADGVLRRDSHVAPTK
jgi:cytoskeleton protein RodZ